MMHNKWIFVFAISLLLTGLAACNKGGDPAPETVGTADVTGEIQADVAKAVADGAEAAAGSAETPASEPVQQADKPAGDLAGQLTGKWFALFGMHDNGVIDKAWEQDQLLELKADGTGSVQKSGDKPSDALFVNWNVTQGKLMLSFQGSKAVTSGLCRIAPLGIARDEETGLLPLAIGRDEEAGLLSGDNPSQSSDDFRRTMITATVEDNYLALRDEYGRLMVYGRLVDGATEAPDLSGDWVGHVDMHDNFPASFTEQNGEIVGTYDHDGGKFVGKFINGYFLGRVDYGSSFSMAALRLTEDWELDGVYVPTPYAEMFDRYDFNRFEQ